MIFLFPYITVLFYQSFIESDVIHSLDLEGYKEKKGNFISFLLPQYFAGETSFISIKVNKQQTTVKFFLQGKVNALSHQYLIHCTVCTHIDNIHLLAADYTSFFSSKVSSTLQTYYFKCSFIPCI